MAGKTQNFFSLRAEHSGFITYILNKLDYINGRLFKPYK